MAERRVVENLDDLKMIIHENGGSAEFYIILGGNFRSSKLINHYPDKGSWYIVNEIDDSEQELPNDKALWEETHIGEALDKHALVWWGW